MRLALTLGLLLLAPWAYADLPLACAALRPLLTREARLRFGLNAPVPALAGQVYQESSCRPHAVSPDGGEGLGQLTGEANIRWVAREAGLGPPDTFNPAWNLRASFWLMDWAARRVAGDDECQRFAAALVAYNGGVGYVLAAQAASARPGQWFEHTEHLPTRQSPDHWRASRDYPRRILFVHQPRFAAWGRTLC